MVHLDFRRSRRAVRFGAMISTVAVLMGALGVVAMGPNASAASAQTVTYSATETIPVPPASNFAGSGGGDGWATAETASQVFNVFHHSSTMTVACHNQSDSTPCWASGTKTITDAAGSNFATSGQPSLWIDQANSRLYVFGTRTSTDEALNDTAGVVAIDISAAAASNADPFSSFTPLSAPGDAPVGGNSYISDAVVVGSNWYAFNFDPTTPSGTQDELMCFSLTTESACSGQPFAVNAGAGAVSVSNFPAPSIAAIGTEIIIPSIVAGSDVLACFDTVSGGNCAGSWPVAISGYPGSGGSPFPLLSASGAVQGFCLPTGSDPCYGPDGASLATPAGMAAALPRNEDWNGPAYVLGPRVYLANGSSGQVDCYDSSTQASCANFPKSLSNLDLLYTVNADPYRGSCIWVNSDNGAAQIQNFDAYTGGACGAGGIRVLAASIVAPAVTCVPATYTSLQILQPAPSTYTKGTVEFEDGDANPIPSLPTATLDATGTVDLSADNLSTASGLPQFLVDLPGASAQQVVVKLVWTGTYDPACATNGVTTTPPPVTTPSTAPGHQAVGYRLQGHDGGVFDFGDSRFYGSLPGSDVVAPIVATANTFDNGGYWMAASNGAVYAYGDAPYLGGITHPLNSPIVAIAATPSQHGYWLVAADGGVFSFGDAQFLGSLGGVRLDKPIVAAAATSNGGGYWLFASDGGVFSFGNAGFFDSLGGLKLNAPIVGGWPTTANDGYWLVASDGGVFAFGKAGFFGSAVGKKLTAPVVAMVGDPSGLGYWLMASDGGVFAFGDAPYFGSMTYETLNKPITSAST